MNDTLARAVSDDNLARMRREAERRQTTPEPADEGDAATQARNERRRRMPPPPDWWDDNVSTTNRVALTEMKQLRGRAKGR